MRGDGIGGLSPEEFSQFESRFDSAKSRSREVSINDPTWQHINALPIFIERIGKLSEGHPSAMRLWAVRNKPADGAFNHAHFALNSARDALVSLYSEVVKAQTITPSSVFLLLRQACEAALIARWLLLDTTTRGLLSRGFAAEWRDMEEYERFIQHMIDAGAIESTQVRRMRHKASQERVRLVTLGKEHRLFKQGTQKPNLKLPTGTGLFSCVVGPAPHTDMRWLFNILSGAAHGKTWASLLLARHEIVKEYLDYTPAGLPMRSEIVQARTDPNLEAMLFPIQVTILQVSAAIDQFQLAEGTEPRALRLR